MKKNSIRMFVPVSAVAAAFGMVAPTAHANIIPIFEANFPASWDGTSTNVVDQSGANNTGFQSGTTHATYTTATVPPGATAGTGSMHVDGAAGIKVTPTAILNNAAIESAGGFSYHINFIWDGTDSSASFGGVEKLVDYAGTESLQLVVPSGAASAALQMTFGGDSSQAPTVPETVAVSTTILPNTWYDATMEFDANGTDGNGVTGTANLYLDGVLVDSAAATKGNYGDTLNRPIGIGEFGYGHSTSIIGLHGNIYDASIQLVPEPSTLALAALGGLALRRVRRRKA